MKPRFFDSVIDVSLFQKQRHLGPKILDTKETRPHTSDRYHADPEFQLK